MMGLYILLSHLVKSQNSRTIRSFIILHWNNYFIKKIFYWKVGHYCVLTERESGAGCLLNGMNHPSPQPGMSNMGRTVGSAAPAQPGIACVEKQRASVLKRTACYLS